MTYRKLTAVVTAALCSLMFLFSCEDGKSYSDLLRDEERATNWYMAQHRIINSVPADSVLEYGADAPFYRLDPDGFLYLQVVDPGDPDTKPKAGDTVYFRFMRKNLKYMYNGSDPKWEGNANDMNSLLGATSFVYEEMAVSSSQKFGQGIQWPLKFVGINSEVNLVMRSYYGFSEDQSQCLAYIYNIKYFKAEF